jgi:DNA-binding response OmpR family regulator
MHRLYLSVLPVTPVAAGWRAIRTDDVTGGVGTRTIVADPCLRASTAGASPRGVAPSAAAGAGGSAPDDHRTRTARGGPGPGCTVFLTASEEVVHVADLLLLTPTSGGPAQVLPALGLLSHRIRVLPVEPSALLEAADSDAVLLDARRDLATARTACRLLRATGLSVPLILVLTEGGMTVVTAEWGAQDLILASAGPAEVETRIRLVIERFATPAHDAAPEEIRAGDLTIDASGYSARLRGRHLDLTYKEFELLKYIVQHPGRVFTRAQLLQEVWGYDYYGGTRTVDVHVRRLRAKLGVEHEQLIGTVRNVGYRFDMPKDRRTDAAHSPSTTDAATDLGQPPDGTPLAESDDSGAATAGKLG